MNFFKANKEIKTEDLKLSDFDKIWTKFCFLDETGTLSNQKDQFFTVGLLKMSQPYYLQSKLLYERSKIHFYDEMKFNKLKIDTFASGFKNHNFNVFVDKTDHVNLANKKGLSS